LKKVFSLILALILTACLGTAAFAASGDIVLTYDLSAGGKNDIVVQTGDVITVSYKLSASEDASAIVTQNEIYYDHTFFEIVPGSNKPSEGFTDYTTTLQERLSGKRYVYFNTMTTHTYTKTPAEIGTFQLKVLAAEGESTVANVNCLATDRNAAQYGAEASNLHVSIGTPQAQTFTITFKGDGDSIYKEITVDSGSSITLPAGPAKRGYTFSHWSIGGDTARYKAGEGYTPGSDITFMPNWTKNSNPGATYYTITADSTSGGSVSPSGTVSAARGSDKTFTITPDKGFRIEDVLVDGKSVGVVSAYTFENVRASHTISARFVKREAADPSDTGVADWLETGDHIAYLKGYGDGRFGPDSNMTRAEAAQMFYNLLKDKEVAVTADFADIPDGIWYEKAANTLEAIGVITGIGNNQFDPDRAITRAEFTVIAMRFAKLDTSGENIFADIDESQWFYEQVKGAVKYGWINGYTDGTFRPHATITRGEVTAITNRMLGRSADKAYVDSHGDTLRTFPDVKSTSWAYYDICEATNSHDYNKTGGTESWTK
jgi:hypothetical protein